MRIHRLILRKLKFDPISDDLHQRLHWLPVSMVWHRHTCSSILTPVSSNQYSCHYRSSARGNSTVPGTRTVRMGLHSFAVSDTGNPELWNFLAPDFKKSQHFFGYFHFNPCLNLNSSKEPTQLLKSLIAIIVFFIYAFVY